MVFYALTFPWSRDVKNREQSPRFSTSPEGPGEC